MNLQFDNDTRVDRLGTGFVYDFARANGVKPVLVRASRMFVEDNWGVNWNNDVAVKAAFDEHKNKYLGAATNAPDTGTNNRVFDIWPKSNTRAN